uniref:DUF4806 domain-containing protein n=1 Tax=Anopheles culicifacies TaxID=139723 RepID=A0A182MAP3_9DIPT
MVKSKSSTKAGKVSRTLCFPLQTSEDIERLEQCVKSSADIKRQYEQILQYFLQKTPLKPAFALLHIFTEAALADYNFSGHCNYTRDKKRAMRNYVIFTSCIESAWDKMLPAEIRGRAIRDVIALVGNRKHLVKAHKSKDPNRDGMFITVSVETNKTDAYTIKFPIESEENVEMLEEWVKLSDNVRQRYVDYLGAVMKQGKSIGAVFGYIFSDAAMYSYNYSGICNRGPRRKAMLGYAIFTECMLEAWKDHGVNETVLRDSLTLIIKQINGRKRNRKYFQKRRANRDIMQMEDADPDSQIIENN